MKIVVTGGAGFIGSNFLLLQVRENPQHEFVNVDRLTYAGNLANLAPIAECPNYRLRVMDIADANEVRGLFEEELPDAVIHFAAESHVDRSIYGPSEFVRTNVWGTFTLLEECRKQWKDKKDKCFLHVSTDEVYGSLGWEGSFTEDSRYDPSSPYSASKASSDHLVRAYGRTYGLPIKITNCSNNYGPRQFPEKLIPLMILNALDGRDLPVYGQGKNVRDWLYVEDHCEALWLVFNRGRIGETYNVGGGAEMSNLQVVHEICRAVADLGSRSYEELTSLIRYVPDRPGHDLRYSICADKIGRDLGWVPRESFLTGLRKTVDWYIANPDWVQDVRSGHYRDWLQQHYGKAD